MPGARTPKPQPLETADQRLARQFAAMVADVAVRVTDAHDTTTTVDIANTVISMHRHLALDPARVHLLVIATAEVFAALYSRRS